ncbi:LIM/homeobox protein Lhx3 [Balamuthia mandrillaris]
MDQPPVSAPLPTLEVPVSLAPPSSLPLSAPLLLHKPLLSPPPTPAGHEATLQPAITTKTSPPPSSYYNRTRYPPTPTAASFVPSTSEEQQPQQQRFQPTHHSDFHRHRRRAQQQQHPQRQQRRLLPGPRSLFLQEEYPRFHSPSPSTSFSSSSSSIPSRFLLGNEMGTATTITTATSISSSSSPFPFSLNAPSPTEFQTRPTRSMSDGWQHDHRWRREPDATDWHSNNKDHNNHEMENNYNFADQYLNSSSTRRHYRHSDLHPSAATSRSHRSHSLFETSPPSNFFASEVDNVLPPMMPHPPPLSSSSPCPSPLLSASSAPSRVRVVAVDGSGVPGEPHGPSYLLDRRRHQQHRYHPQRSAKEELTRLSSFEEDTEDGRYRLNMLMRRIEQDEGDDLEAGEEDSTAVERDQRTSFSSSQEEMLYPSSSSQRKLQPPYRTYDQVFHEARVLGYQQGLEEARTSSDFSCATVIYNNEPMGHKQAKVERKRKKQHSSKRNNKTVEEARPKLLFHEHHLDPQSFVSAGEERRKRQRINTDAVQLAILEKAFEENNVPSRQCKLRLATETGLSLNRVQVWFQNRRAKERRLRQEREEQELELEREREREQLAT